MQTDDRLFQDTVEAVRSAGELVCSAWDKPRNIRYKGPIDLVTDTDVAVEEELKNTLGRLLPEADFLAEESAGDKVLGQGPTWIIDPLDGTTNFAHKIPFVAVSVGLWTDDQVVMGIVYLPIMQEMFAAFQGRGAFCNNREIRVSGTDSLKPALVATGFPYALLQELDSIMVYMRKVLASTRGVRRCGSAATDLAYTAAGRLDGFYELGLKPWDTAAGVCLIQEAGGKVSTFDGSPFRPGMREILGTNALIHEQMTSLLTG
ncbi:MAG: inositol monophosphatase family protein [Desulfonatronovibrionaceae bacterium]